MNVWLSVGGKKKAKLLFMVTLEIAWNRIIYYKNNGSFIIVISALVIT